MPAPSTSHKNWAPLFLHRGKFHLLFQKQLNLASSSAKVYTAGRGRGFNSSRQFRAGDQKEVQDENTLAASRMALWVKLLQLGYQLWREVGRREALGWRCAERTARLQAGKPVPREGARRSGIPGHFSKQLLGRRESMGEKKEKHL